MKKLLKILFSLIICALLFGCTGTGIGKRAIVKAMYVSFENGEYVTSIVVFNCDPTSQIAEIKESASVYSASAETIALAISKAEKKQNKVPFYAQNEVLFIGEAAAAKFTEIIDFFSAEVASRPGLSVYITQKTAAELEAATAVLPKLIKQCENASQGAAQNTSRKIFEIKKQHGEYCAILPRLTFSEKPEEFFGVKNLVSIANNSIGASFENENLTLVLLLESALKKLKLADISNSKISFEADGLLISYSLNAKNRTLNVSLNGNIRALSCSEKNTLNREDVLLLESEINAYLQENCSNIINSFYSAGNDAFNYKWHFDIFDKQLYRNGKIRFSSQLKVL